METTDESIIKLRLKVVVPIVGFLLVVSNMFTRYITVIGENEKDIEYNVEAGNRRIKNAIIVSDLKHEIKHLTQELKDCKDETK